MRGNIFEIFQNFHNKKRALLKKINLSKKVRILTKNLWSNLWPNYFNSVSSKTQISNKLLKIKKNNKIIRCSEQ